MWPAGHQHNWKFSAGDQNFNAGHQQAANFQCLVNVLNRSTQGINYVLNGKILHLISRRNLPLVLSKCLISIENNSGYEKTKSIDFLHANEITKGGRLVQIILFSSDLVQVAWRLASRCVSDWKGSCVIMFSLQTKRAISLRKSPFQLRHLSYLYTIIIMPFCMWQSHFCIRSQVLKIMF